MCVDISWGILPEVVCDISKHQKRVQVKEIGLVHNYIILANG